MFGLAWITYAFFYYSGERAMPCEGECWFCEETRALVNYALAGGCV